MEPNDMKSNHEDLFHASFARVTKADDFFEHFYQHFCSSSEEVTEKFKDTDMATQRAMMAQSLIHMVAFFGSGEPSETLQRLAVVHSKAQKNIEWHFYDDWLEALIATVREHDRKWSGSVEVAWRIVLAPGIAYMKSQYAPEV